jgi:5-methylcytosine-specific restriction endonuclease McrA
MSRESEFKSISAQRYHAMQQRARKGEKRGRAVIVPPVADLPFTMEEFREWLQSRFTNGGTTPCVYCCAPVDLMKCQIDHALPISRGGGRFFGNLCIACPECNQAKGKMNSREFQELLRLLNDVGVFGEEGRQSVMSRLQSQLKLAKDNIILRKQLHGAKGSGWRKTARR